MQKCRAQRGIRRYPFERKRWSGSVYVLGDHLIDLLDLEGVEYRRYQLEGVFVLELYQKPSWAFAQLLARL